MKRIELNSGFKVLNLLWFEVVNFIITNMDGQVHGPSGVKWSLELIDVYNVNAVIHFEI